MRLHSRTAVLVAGCTMGLRAGDVIIEVNRTATPSVEAFRKALQDSDQEALLLIYRDGATLYLSLSK